MSESADRGGGTPAGESEGTPGPLDPDAWSELEELVRDPGRLAALEESLERHLGREVNARTMEYLQDSGEALSLEKLVFYLAWVSYDTDSLSREADAAGASEEARALFQRLVAVYGSGLQQARFLGTDNHDWRAARVEVKESVSGDERDRVFDIEIVKKNRESMKLTVSELSYIRLMGRLARRLEFVRPEKVESDEVRSLIDRVLRLAEEHDQDAEPPALEGTEPAQPSE